MDLRAMLNTDGGGGAGAGAGAGTGEAARGTATTTPGASGGISASSSSSRQPSQPPAPGPVSMPSPSVTMNGLHGTPSSSVAPVTPVQTGPPPNAFRNYSHSTHASPVMQHHDYPPSAGSYQSPTSYHPAPPAGPFGTRPHVPPIQPPGHGHSLSHDTRSPGSASMPAPSPSYRQTPPASSMNPGAQGYPFPPTSQPPPPASPSQRQQQYGSQAGYGPRDSYSSRQQSPVPPPIGMPTMPSRMPSQGSAASSSPYGQGPPHPSQQQQQQAMPQTPPIGTPGGASGSSAGGLGGAAYIQHQQHQRSLSVQSVTTPTSAHSQQPPFGPPYVQGSPATMTHQALPQQQQHLDRHPSQRQSSQPPTPLGPPMSGPIRQSPATTYREPPSPYQQTQQQRTPSSATIATITNIPYPPQPQPMQTSPPPPAPATIQQQKQQILLQQQQQEQRIQQEHQQQQHHQHLQRLSNSSYNAYDVAAASESHRRSMSQHSRILQKPDR